MGCEIYERIEVVSKIVDKIWWRYEVVKAVLHCEWEVAFCEYSISDKWF
jgi:hypothetical protein